MGQLTVQNGTDADGVVILTSQAGAPMMAAYIRVGETALMGGIGDGTYLLYFSKGSRWSTATAEFTENVTLQRFTDLFPFNTTATSSTSWTVTLFGVAGGNAGSQYVDPGSFPDI